MKNTLLKFSTLFFILSYVFFIAQETDKMEIPTGIVYNKANEETNEKAKKLIEDGLQKGDYSLLQSKLIIGPTLWNNWKDIESLKSIPTKVKFHIDDKIIEGKATENNAEAKIVWNELKRNIANGFKIRKANKTELEYYWATISFDIDEPLFILESNEHFYILNFIKKDLKLFWIDEIPNKKKSYYNPIENSTDKTEGEFKSYQNGKEVSVKDKGIRETKLERVVLLSSDKDLKENTSIEDIQVIMNKTTTIFNNLFSNIKASGKIMVQFNLNKKKNEIQFAVQDDVDLEIMKEFEKLINKEKYPNSKKETIKFQLIYKVNSFNDLE